MKVGDTVTVVRGPHRGEVGTVFWRGKSKYRFATPRLGIEHGRVRIFVDAVDVAPDIHEDPHDDSWGSHMEEFGYEPGDS